MRSGFAARAGTGQNTDGFLLCQLVTAPHLEGFRWDKSNEAHAPSQAWLHSLLLREPAAQPDPVNIDPYWSKRGPSITCHCSTRNMSFRVYISSVCSHSLYARDLDQSGSSQAAVSSILTKFYSLIYPLAALKRLYGYLALTNISQNDAITVTFLDCFIVH